MKEFIDKNIEKNKTMFNFSNKAFNLLNALCDEFKFTFQEIKKLSEIIKDLDNWDIKEYEYTISTYIKENKVKDNPLISKKNFLSKLDDYYEEIKNSPKSYDLLNNKEVIKNSSILITPKDFSSNILGACPVYSEKTICCGLKTLDAVQNCPFNCSYCTIQTFYDDNFIAVKNLNEKLQEIKLEKNKFYHIGTGQSTDSLFWGNEFNILDSLLNFAKNNKNILLEFKTKSSNISYFLEKKDIPSNIVCSWTLNTPKVISNEEKGTASLENRIESAKALSEKGIKVAFHFHPIIYYDTWEEDYKNIIKTIKEKILPENISFISFGSLTFIKPVIKQIRNKNQKSKILWMPTSYDPNKKITYPTELKVKLYKTLYDEFNEWKEKVYFYLCMETKEIWEEVFGFSYKNNEDFLIDFGKKTIKFPK